MVQRRLSTAEWKIDVWAGKTTYADTPIVPIRPQIGAAALDCELPDGVPVIKRVDGPGAQGGPWVANPADPAANTVTITALGDIRFETRIRISEAPRSVTMASG